MVLLASLQVLHMMLLSRLDEKNALWQREEVIKNIQRDKDRLYTAMKNALENTHIVDSSGQYRIINNFYDTTNRRIVKNEGAQNSHTQSQNKATRKSVENTLSVTIVSHCSVNHLPHLAALTQRWHGPVSVSVFATDSKSIYAAMEYLLQLYQCVPSMRHNVTVHLVYPLVQSLNSLPDFRPTESLNSFSCSDLQGPVGHKLFQSRNYALTKSLKYPNNMLRNVAWGNVRTDYVFPIDIDMLPNSNLHNEFVSFLHRLSLSTQGKVLDERTVFVVPAFELQHGLSVPLDKKALLSIWRQRELRPFYYEMCSRCQKPTEYEAWRNLSLAAPLSVGYEVEWKDPWEPFYIGPQSLPHYDERFKQYGFNRISQVRSSLHTCTY